MARCTWTIRIQLTEGRAPVHVCGNPRREPDRLPIDNLAFLTRSYRFSDEAHIPLSEGQLAVFNGWRRPHELFPESESTYRDEVLSCGPPMITQDTVDLVQDVTTDCSFVASLCAGTARAERGHPKVSFPRGRTASPTLKGAQIMSSIMYPYDHQLMKASISRNGKYIFKLHFNGCFRKVVIDDRLPSSRNSRSLHVIDRGNPRLLWPALLEKAYLKVRGGYDLPGSNSGTDIWVITSWIPEQLFLQRCVKWVASLCKVP